MSLAAVPIQISGGDARLLSKQEVWLTALDAKRGTVIWRTNLHPMVVAPLAAENADKPDGEKERNPVVLRGFSMAGDAFVFPLLPKQYAICK